MTVNTGTFEQAHLHGIDQGDPYHKLLTHASCQIFPEAVVVTHYLSPDKLPQTKRTLVLNPNNFISFIGMGYAK